MTASKNIKMEAAYRAMVDRFLGWKLPQDFGPDAGISFTPPPHLPDLYWPTGTNLFHAGQALEMFKHCVELPSAAAVRLAEKNLFDMQEAAKIITKQAIAAEAERDALAAKLKEVDGRIDDLLATCHRLALELECLLLDTKDSAPVSRWWDSAMAALDGWHKAKDAASARPVPAEPVNARLLEALQGMIRLYLRGRKEHFGSSTKEMKSARAALAAAEAQQESPVPMVVSWPWLRGVISAIPTRVEKSGGQNHRYVALDEVLGWLEEGQRRADEAQQAEPVSDALQDMHDAGREVDRVMAEAAPKAARLTDEEIASLLAASDKNSPRVPSFFMTEPHKFARAIETAAIRKNGLAMEAQP